MTYNTGNAVPSTDPRDLDDNAQAFDRLLQSSAASEPDRLGALRKTWSQMERDAAALVSPNVSALAGLTGAPDRVPYFTGAGALSLAVFTAVARNLLAASTQAAQRAALALGTAATLNSGVANGVATLGADGLLPVSQLPPLAISSTFTVASQAAMLALTAERGDVAIRSDLSGAAYILTADAPATLANWVAIQQNLGVALTALGALTPAADTLGYFSGTNTAATTAFPAQARALLSATSQASQRTAMGVLAQTDKPTWTSYTPNVTASSGAYTTVSATAKYLVLFGVCFIEATITVTTKGTGVNPNINLPFPALAGSSNHVIPARESALNGKLGAAVVLPALNSVTCFDYANGDLVTANGSIVQISGSYPIA